MSGRAPVPSPTLVLWRRIIAPALAAVVLLTACRWPWRRPPGAGSEAGSDPSPALATGAGTASDTATGSDQARDGTKTTGTNSATATEGEPPPADDAAVFSIDKGGIANAPGVVVEAPAGLATVPARLKVELIQQNGSDTPAGLLLKDGERLRLAARWSAAEVGSGTAIDRFAAPAGAEPPALRITATVPGPPAVDRATARVLLAVDATPAALASASRLPADAVEVTPHPDGSTIIRFASRSPAAVLAVVAEPTYVEVPLDLEPPRWVNAPDELILTAGVAVPAPIFHATDPDPGATLVHALAADGSTCLAAGAFSTPPALDAASGRLSGVPTIAADRCVLRVTATSQGRTIEHVAVVRILATPATFCDETTAGGACVIRGPRNLPAGTVFNLPGDLVLAAGAALAPLPEGTLRLSVTGALRAESGAMIEGRTLEISAAAIQIGGGARLTARDGAQSPARGGSATLSAAAALVMDGELTAGGDRGLNGVMEGGPGGPGGTLRITGATISGAGTVTANGGDGGLARDTDRHGPGGAGGSVVLEFLSQDTYTGVIEARGGAATAPAAAGGQGTVTRLRTGG